MNVSRPKQRILLVGAGRGIGRHLRENLLQQGHEIFGAGLSGPNARIDLRNADHVNCWSVVQQAKNVLGGDIDTMIFNAGMLDIAKTGEQNPMQLEHLMRVNLLAPFYFMEALYYETENTTRQFIKPRRVIFTSSMAAVTPMRSSAAYCASKAGLEMAVQCWAKELGPEFGFSVMGVAPGTVRSTGMFETLKTKTMAKLPENHGHIANETNAEQEISKHNQLGRALSLDEVWMTYNMVVNMTGYEHNGQIFRIS